MAPNPYIYPYHWEGILISSRSGPPYTIHQSRSHLQEMISAPNNGISSFVIALESADCVIGKLAIWEPNTGEIGFLLHHSYWGKGYMAEAFAAFLQHLWSGKGRDVQILRADVDPRNEASLGILKKFGFVATGYKKNTIETHLGWCDSVYLALENPNLTDQQKRQSSIILDEI